MVSVVVSAVVSAEVSPEVIGRETWTSTDSVPTAGGKGTGESGRSSQSVQVVSISKVASERITRLLAWPVVSTPRTLKPTSDARALNRTVALTQLYWPVARVAATLERFCS